jgi:hypothetical protein
VPPDTDSDGVCDELDDDVDGEIFETYGNLLRFAERKVQG